jgi:HlyD family secretion protein
MDRQIEKKKWTRTKLLKYFGISSVALFLVILMLNGTSSRTYTLSRDRALIEPVVYGHFEDDIPVNGIVEPLTTVFITAPEGGNVEEIFVEDGDVVEEGQPLLRLSNASLMLDYMNRETQIIEQINNLRNTRLTMEQNQRMLNDQLLDVQYQKREAERRYLLDSGLYVDAVIAEQQWLDSRNNYFYLEDKEKLLIESIERESQNREWQLDRIDESIFRMERNLEAIRSNMENLTIKSPIRGQLTSFNAELGQAKSKGQNLGSINVMKGYKVSAMIDEFYLNRIHPGQEAVFNLRSRQLGLRVIKVIPEVLNNQFEVEMAFTDSIVEGITRGQNLSIKLSLSAGTESLMLPKGGFYQSTGGDYVFVMVDDEIAEKRKVRLGRIGADYIEVLDGLEEGERVLINSYTTYGEAEELKFKN